MAYHRPPSKCELMKTVTPNDLQRVAARLFRDASIASVVVGNSELVKTSVERYGKVELMGEVSLELVQNGDRPEFW